jgi:hypothetical protein
MSDLHGYPLSKLPVGRRSASSGVHKFRDWCAVGSLLAQSIDRDNLPQSDLENCENRTTPECIVIYSGTSGMGTNYLRVIDLLPHGFQEHLTRGVRAENPTVSVSVQDYRKYSDVDSKVEETFRALALQWKRERVGTASGMSMFMEPSYQKIIGLGEAAIPSILRELERDLDHWFWALAAISREDPVPVPNKGNLIEMRKYWLDWGRRKGYLWR